MIFLSKKEILSNFSLLYGFLSFWNMSVNAFYLPFSMISFTLHNVAAIIGLLMDGDKVPFLDNVLGIDLGFQVNKKNNAYSTFINTFNRGNSPINKIGHRAFRLFWICQFFTCTSSIAVVAEFAPYVSAILSRSYLNIGALFLLLPYKDVFTILYWIKEGESMKMVFDPFWFLQLWVQQYFSEFLAKVALTCTIQPTMYGDYYM